MSTTPPSAKTKPVPPEIHDQREIRIYSHSQLFYWWPVWATAFILAGWTWLEGDRMAILPAGTKITKAESGQGYILTAPTLTAAGTAF